MGSLRKGTRAHESKGNQGIIKENKGSLRKTRGH